VPAPIRFHFDFISPYAWLAWNRIHLLAERHGRRVEVVPVLFAALLGHWGHLGPAEIPPKRSYIMKDVFRTAALTGIPIHLPPAHPFNPLLALRVACVPGPPERRRALIQGLYAAVWGGGPGVEDPAEVARVADAAGLSGAALVEAAGTPEVKGLLRANTEAAIEAGVFGVPTMIVHGELFWGFDSFVHLDRFLGGEDPVRGEDVAAWEALEGTAHRRR